MIPSDQAATPLPLFRQEVLCAGSRQAFGAIRLAQPLSAWLIAGCALLLATALIAFIACGSVTRKSRIAGLTVAETGSIRIAAPNAGVLTHAHVQEGQNVIAGQMLFELSMARHGADGELSALVARQLALQQQTLESEQRLRTIQYRDKKRALHERLQNLRLEAEHLKHEITLAERRHALALNSQDKFAMLQQNGYVSAAQTQQKQEDAIDMAARLGSLKRSKVQLETARLALQAELASIETELATGLAQLQRASASLQQEVTENLSRKSTRITAPHTGVITTVTYEPGQTVAAGQVLSTLIPRRANGRADDPVMEVHLYAPSRTAGFVAAGQQVVLRYQAYPYQKFGLQSGAVVDVSATPFAPSELPQHLASTILGNAQQGMAGIHGSEALYRIKVRPERQTIDTYGQAQILKPGMTLEADVIQDKRKIWEWITEPLLAVARRH